MEYQIDWIIQIHVWQRLVLLATAQWFCVASCYSITSFWNAMMKCEVNSSKFCCVYGGHVRKEDVPSRIAYHKRQRIILYRLLLNHQYRWTDGHHIYFVWCESGSEILMDKHRISSPLSDHTKLLVASYPKLDSKLGYDVGEYFLFNPG